ncbi:MAG: shikimate dehydrogenase family protein [Myxococcota bacterium]
MKLAVLGGDVSRSLSPRMHAAAAKALSVDVEYVAISCRDVETFREQMDMLRREGARGVNVTSPYKLDAFQMSEQTTDAADEIGGVNTICFGDRVVGDNTDGPGLLRWWTTEPDLWFERVLILGAGGAARAVVWALRRRGAGEILVAARRAQPWVDDFGARPVGLVPQPGVTLVVSCLPEVAAEAGLQVLRGMGDQAATAPLFDLNYRPDGEYPALAAWAAGQGMDLRDGRRMLAEQGALSLALWTGAQLEPIRKAMLDFMTTVRTQF